MLTLHYGVSRLSFCHAGSHTGTALSVNNQSQHIVGSFLYGNIAGCLCKRACIFTLQHADSMGTLLSDSTQSSLQAAASSSTLSSSVDEAETERPVAEDSTNRWLSLDWLSINGLETCRLETAFHKKKEDEKEEALEKVRKRCGEDEDEEILVKDEQVADFASSVLAAISCWRYKARALLFTRVPTVRLTVTICFSFPSSLCLPMSPHCSVLNSHASQIPLCCMLHLMSAAGRCSASHLHG